MSIDLPPPIDLYIRIENSGDVEALPECFASDATVRDERQRYQGLPAIRQWMADTKKKYHHTIAPLGVTQGDGTSVLEAQLTGNFPGSPVTMQFSFVLEAGKIASLEIHG